MKRLLAALGLALALAAPAYSLEPIREGQETFISRAVFAQGKLWVLSDAGELYTFTEGQKTRTAVTLHEPAQDLWLSGGMPTVATCSLHCTAWTLRHFDGQAWRDVGSVKVKSREALVVVTEAEGKTILVTRQRVIEHTGSEERSIPYQLQLIGPGRMTSVLAEPARIVIGENSGEWGGGLYAIDRTVKGGEAQTPRELCLGDAVAICGPINGIVPEPWNPGCSVVAVGLIHFLPEGRLLEMCGTTLRRLYFRNLPCPEPKPGYTSLCADAKPGPNGEISMQTVPFFGLARSGQVIWAAGGDGLYKITEHGVEHLGVLPKFENYGGTWVSFEIPGVVLVLTEINSRASLSGATPLIVSRE